ncbi:MAG: tyrosine-type recombinase/integrase [Burkholderiales bacterium]|nr:tyrosine-type recombinase/integrase [Burkholderiales bacterium]
MAKLELKSPLGTEMLEYRQHRINNLRYCQESSRDGLYRGLDSLLISFGAKEKAISREVAEAWCRKKSYESPGTQRRRVSFLRQFCLYLSDRGYKVYIPPRKTAQAARKYDAHIFSDDELHRFFQAVDHPKFANAGTVRRDLMMPLYFRILYTSGMRVTELATIRIADIDIEKAVITVRNGKNGKDRLVPFHQSLGETCGKVIDLIGAASDSKDYFFQIKEGKCPSRNYIYYRFREALEQAGISHLGRGRGPRVHDFRHTYCVNLLRKWIHEKRNLLACMPYMRTMLGHTGFEETAYYLKLTSREFPEVRDQVGAKFPNIIEEPKDDEPEFY